MLSVSRYFRDRGRRRGVLRGVLRGRRRGVLRGVLRGRRRRSKLEGRRCQRNHSFIMCLNT
tara:strand:- start:317 stop:499 length:183 start_codon:yes stop_codon:yes gene_type:complete